MRSPRFHAILVDNGLLRLNEAAEASHKLREQLKVNLKVVDASDLFLSRLAGVRPIAVFGRGAREGARRRGRRA